MHLFLALPEELDRADLRERYLALLCDDERERHARLRFERDRQVFVVARALVRTALSRYLPVAPKAWRFERTEHGRPEIDVGRTEREHARSAGPQAGSAIPHVDSGVDRLDRESLSASSLCFNLSHTRGCVALAVAAGQGIGVDVEDVRRSLDVDGIAARWFGPAERADLEQLVDSQRPSQFFRYWTLKEAYTKARGLGLRLPIARLEFDLRACTVFPPDERSWHPDAAIPCCNRIQLRPAGDIEEAPGAWQLTQLWPTPQHVVSLAVRRHGQVARRVRARFLAPLVAAGPPFGSYD